MKLTHKISGFREANAAFKELPPVVADRVLRTATLRGAREWSRGIRSAAPKNDGDRSPMSLRYGTLRRNIRAFGMRRMKRAQAGARVDTRNAFWGWFIEKGTRYIAAKPWFLPAARAGEAAALAELVSTIRERLPIEAVKVALKNGVKRK